MPISYICQSNSTAITSDLSKTSDGRALLSYLNQHSRDGVVPVPISSAAAPTNSSSSRDHLFHHPFSFELNSLFGTRSPPLTFNLDLFRQLLNPQLSENVSTMHIGTNDTGDGNAGRSVVLLVRGGQPTSLQTSSQ